MSYLYSNLKFSTTISKYVNHMVTDMCWILKGKNFKMKYIIYKDMDLIGRNMKSRSVQLEEILDL